MHSASRGGNRRRGSAARGRGCYLPREVFFGRLGFAGAFFTVWASDFERFLPATSDSFPIDVLPDAPYRGTAACCRGSASAWPRVYAVAVHADLLETVGRKRAVPSADRGCVPVRSELEFRSASWMSRNGGTAAETV